VNSDAVEVARIAETFRFLGAHRGWRQCAPLRNVLSKSREGLVADRVDGCNSGPQTGSGQRIRAVAGISSGGKKTLERPIFVVDGIRMSRTTAPRRSANGGNVTSALGDIRPEESTTSRS